MWFGRNVAGTYQLIARLRDNPRLDVTVIGTYPRLDHLMLQACDEAALEPLVPDDEYVEWAIDFCSVNDVEVCVPGEQRQLALALARDRFAAHGTRVQVSRPEVVATLQDKAETYRQAAQIGLPVPAYAVVTTGDELRAAFEQLSASGDAVTLKPVRGFGGAGFWKLTDSPLGLDALLALPDGRLHIDAAAAILDRAETPVPPLLVSHYLSSPEDSVDVLACGGKMLASVIRRKPSIGQSRSFPVDPELTELTRRAVAHFGPDYLCNVQWRRTNGRPMLLEVNTRAASGLDQSCESGVNFPYLALALTLGIEVDVPAPRPQAEQVTFTAAVEMHPLAPPLQ